MRKIPAMLFILVLSSFLFPLTAFADENITLQGKDEEGSYIYEFKDYGTFRTNLEENDVEEVAYIECDDTLTMSVMKDGVSYEYEDDVFYENGKYVVFIYSGDAADFATFSFEIKNDIFAGTGEDSKKESDDDFEDFDFSKIGMPDDGSEEELDLSAFGDIGALLGNYSNKESKSIDFDYAYSAEYKEIVYSFNGKDYFSADVANQALVTGEVHVAAIDPNFSYYFYYNDEVDFAAEDAVYTEPGKYEFVVFINLPEGGMGELRFGFTIMDEVTASIEKITAPEGFFIKKVTLNGFQIETDEEDTLISEDGHYDFVFACKEHKGLSYNLAFTKDTVAPTLSFSKDISKGKVKAPLSYTIDEEGSTVRIRTGGYDVTIAEGTDIYTRGQYSFVVTDLAGNENSYDVYISTSYKLGKQGLIFLGIFVLVVGAYLALVRFGSKYGV